MPFLAGCVLLPAGYLPPHQFDLYRQRSRVMAFQSTRLLTLFNEFQLYCSREPCEFKSCPSQGFFYLQPGTSHRTSSICTGNVLVIMPSKVPDSLRSSTNFNQTFSPNLASKNAVSRRVCSTTSRVPPTAPVRFVPATFSSYGLPKYPTPYALQRISIILFPRTLRVQILPLTGFFLPPAGYLPPHQLDLYRQRSRVMAFQSTRLLTLFN